MPSLTLLQAEFEQAQERYKALHAEHGDKPSPEARSEMVSLTEQMARMQEGIEQIKYEESRRDYERLDQWSRDPYVQIKHAVNNDDTGKRELLQAGWEIRGGMVHIPTSDGKLTPFVPEEVAFGPIPTGADPLSRMQAEYFTKTRAAMQPMYRRAYEKLLRESVRHRSEAVAMMQLSGDEQRALAEGADATGGYLVPPDVQAEMLQRVAQRAVMRRIARVVTTSSDHVEFPAVAANSTSGSIYSSGFVGTWATETPAFSDTDPSFQKFSIAIKKARVTTKLSQDFVADAVINVLAWIAQNGAENLALVEDEGLIAGDGTGSRPVGILQSGSTELDVEGTTSNNISNTAADLGSATKLITLAHALPSAYATNAAWLMARQTEGEIRALTSGNLGYAVVPVTQNQLGGWERALLGAPIYNSDFVPVDNTNANRVLVYGDFSNYIIAQRAQISSTILRERFADTDQIGVIVSERIGGGCWNTDAFRIGIV